MGFYIKVLWVFLVDYLVEMISVSVYWVLCRPGRWPFGLEPPVDSRNGDLLKRNKMLWPSAPYALRAHCGFYDCEDDGWLELPCVFAASLLDWNLISLINMSIFFAIRFVSPTRGMFVMTDIFFFFHSIMLHCRFVRLFIIWWTYFEELSSCCKLISVTVLQ